MTVFDRFTRDEVSQWVWWPAAMVLVVLVVLTFPGQNRAIDQRRDDATLRAWTLATGSIRAALDGAPAEPVEGQPSARLEQVVAADAIEEPWTDTVRIWAADSTLLWSSDPDDPVGSAGGLNDEEITRALADLTRADQALRDRDLDGRPSEPSFSAYAPFIFGGEIAAAEFEVRDATLLDDVKTDWLALRIVLGAAVALTLALAIGSMREPVARIGAGVPFSRSSLAPGTDVIDVERKIELERAGELARERVASMELRLHDSEQQRLRAEGELQRALSQLAARSARQGTRSVIPRGTPAEPPATEPAGPAPVVSVIPEAPLTRQAPPAASTATSTLPAPTDQPAARPAAPSVSAPAPVGQATPFEGPASEEPASAPPAASSRAPSEGLSLVPPLEGPTTPGIDPTPSVAGTSPALPTSPAAPTAPASALRPSEPRHPSRRPSVVPASEPPAGPPGDPRGDDLVIVPDASPRSTPRTAAPSPPPEAARPQPSSPTDPNDDGDARNVLERLVDPVAPSVTPATDPGALRAALARTAARKKPGARHDERLADDTPDR
ncbi:MAG TPA: hypothetical protein VLA82_05535 [Actinomycetota bacterium]|nr:hypothetical protein [Actinomycetota bacterium]